MILGEPQGIRITVGTNSRVESSPASSGVRLVTGSNRSVNAVFGDPSTIGMTIAVPIVNVPNYTTYLMTVL